MPRYLIHCKSLTYAQRAARVLEKRGLTVTIARLPQTAAGEGCTYCVRVPERNLPAARTLLKQAGLQVQRIFREDEDGSLWEVST